GYKQCYVMLNRTRREMKGQPNFTRTTRLERIVLLFCVGNILFSIHSLKGGQVVAWGDNAYGQANVPSGLSNAVAISAGASYSLAVRSDGTVTAIGAASVPSGLSNVVAVAGGCLSV